MTDRHSNDEATSALTGVASLPMPEASHFVVCRLGPCSYPAPQHSGQQHFTRDDDAVLATASRNDVQRIQSSGQPLPAFELAGPRERLHFSPETIAAGIVTCGGLCPGMNNVIRAIVLTLHHTYGTPDIYGFRYGFAGLGTDLHDPVMLSPKLVDGIHEYGGTLLGSSRGPQDPATMVDRLQSLGIRMLFAVGGDGTLRGVQQIADEINDRGLDIAVIGIPKTIDNDIQWIERSFGFATAVEEAVRVIDAAHNEARGVWNGVGLVKLMGRNSGFIAAHATLASSVVNFCLVPETGLRLTGPGGFLEALEARLNDRHHAVVVVAEGAGQDLLNCGDPGHDRSGNAHLGDIGGFLAARIKRHFDDIGMDGTVKYLDPSYTIRSLQANAIDAEFCFALGQNAVHAAMAGRTNAMIGYWNQSFTHVPIELAVGHPRRLDPAGQEWQRVLQTTGQSGLTLSR
jgi:6-phosphofructokinase 1